MVRLNKARGTNAPHEAWIREQHRPIRLNGQDTLTRTNKLAMFDGYRG